MCVKAEERGREIGIKIGQEDLLNEMMEEMLLYSDERGPWLREIAKRKSITLKQNT